MDKNQKNYDEKFMRKAIIEAQKSAKEMEVPVGAVIVRENKIISRGRNRRETLKNSILHAETEAIIKACKKLGSWRLLDCTLYVTLEPCPMCAGAIINSRIARVVYAAKDQKAGSCGSIINLFDLPYNHKPILTSGILENECSRVLTNFFRELRNQKN